MCFLALNTIFVENVYVVAKVKQTDDGALNVRARVTIDGSTSKMVNTMKTYRQTDCALFRISATFISNFKKATLLKVLILVMTR